MNALRPYYSAKYLTRTFLIGLGISLFLVLTGMVTSPWVLLLVCVLITLGVPAMIAKEDLVENEERESGMDSL